MDIIAGIVLYHPQMVRFKKCINSILQQVDRVILFDNGDNNPSKYLSISEKIIYLSNGENLGIAKALNIILDTALSKGYKWVITFDQDTLVPSNMIDEYKKYMDSNVGIITAQIIDERRPYMKLEKKEGCKHVDFCITSASCTNTMAWKEIGGFDEWLFIDFVDNDFCKRMIMNEYSIVRVNNVVINQEFGDIELKTPRKVRFYLYLSDKLKNVNVAKLSYKKKVNPIRVYYTHRNLLYLNKKFKNYQGIGYENFNCKSFLGFLVCFSLPSFIRGKKKVKILKAIIKGLLDGHKAAQDCKSIEGKR